MCERIHQIYAASLHAPLQLPQPTHEIFQAPRLSEVPVGMLGIRSRVTVQIVLLDYRQGAATLDTLENKTIIPLTSHPFDT